MFGQRTGDRRSGNTLGDRLGDDALQHANPLQFLAVAFPGQALQPADVHCAEQET